MLLNKLIPAILWALFILGLCALPGTVIPDLTFLEWLKPDKLIHLFLFGVLSFLLIKGFGEQISFQFLIRNSKWIAVLFSCLYGVLVEYIQNYVPTRRGDVFDAMADAVGAFVGLWAFNVWKRSRWARS